MNFNGLSPEQKKLIFDLSKRIGLLEAHLKRLQSSVVKVEPVLPAELAKSITHIHLN
jgi:hypothetical protein